MANCLRRLLPTDLSADIQKMSHIVRYSDVKRYVIDQVGLRLLTTKSEQKVTQMVSNQWTRASLNITMKKSQERPLENDESDLHALKGKGKVKGLMEQCFRCGQYGHRVAECRKKDVDMMKGKGKNKGLGKGKNPPQRQRKTLVPTLSL